MKNESFGGHHEKEPDYHTIHVFNRLNRPAIKLMDYL
jgi:hypothetical protein